VAKRRKPVVGVCGLCDQVKTLHESHIVPAAIWRWLKNRPGPNPFRLVRRMPDNRYKIEVIQDGDKIHLLCFQCEQKLGVWEKSFMEKFFVPFHETPTFRVEYGQWLALFSASLVWRILHIATGRATYFNVPAPSLLRPTIDALRTWKAFLTGHARSTGRHELHLVPLGTAGEDYDRIQYIEFTIDTKITGSPVRKDFWVFAKLIGILIVGIIRDPALTNWRHTKIHPGRGVWDGGQEFAAPDSLRRYLLATVEEDAEQARQDQEIVFRRAKTIHRPK
jgi:hypothetical protein